MAHQLLPDSLRVPDSLLVYTDPVFFLLLVGLFVFFGLVARRIFQRITLAWARKTETKLDDILLAAVHRPILLWFLMGGAMAGVSLTHLDPPVIDLVNKAISVLLVLSIVLVVARIATELLRNYGSRVPSLKPMMGVSQRIARIFIWLIGGMFILNALGVSITPLLASLGIAGLAVALALQETLGNFFSGFYLMADRPIRTGDYVKLDSGVEGYVLDIGWRSTRIRELPNNVIVIPNSKLAQSTITNYYLPEPELAVLVNVSVAYGSDLKHVERVTIEVAKEVEREVAGGIPAFEPFIRYNTFGDSGIGFTVIMRGKEFVDRFLITHEFMKRLHERYAKEGIEIPFPQRVVHMKSS